MATENATTRGIVSAIRADLDRDHDVRSRRIKTWIALQCLLIVLVAGYMTWILGALGDLDADSLTRLAAVEIHEELPGLRADLTDYALEMAPELTDQARDVLLGIPAHLRASIETQLLEETERLLTDFERDLDGALTELVAVQMEQLKASLGDVPPERQLDTIVTDVSGLFRDTMIEAVDELYIDYAREVRKLNAHLDHLLRSPDLTEAEQLDKQLIETWMLLVQKHRVTEMAAWSS